MIDFLTAIPLQASIMLTALMAAPIAITAAKPSLTDHKAYLVIAAIMFLLGACFALSTITHLLFA
jgi:hypothetical protein